MKTQEEKKIKTSILLKESSMGMLAILCELENRKAGQMMEVLVRDEFKRRNLELPKPE